jgi:hypothetical protein
VRVQVGQRFGGEMPAGRRDERVDRGGPLAQRRQPDVVTRDRVGERRVELLVIASGGHPADAARVERARRRRRLDPVANRGLRRRVEAVGVLDADRDRAADRSRLRRARERRLGIDRGRAA